MTQTISRAAGLFIVCALSLLAQTAPHPEPGSNTWTVSQPYADNPLRQATIPGSATAAETRTAELQVECRAPESPRVNLVFVAPIPGFNLDPFEGPPGIGQKRKLLALTLDQRPPQPYNFSGFYIESDRFVLSFAPSRVDMQRIMASPAKPVYVRVTPAEGAGQPLIFDFLLPANPSPLQAVTRPCLRSQPQEHPTHP